MRKTRHKARADTPATRRQFERLTIEVPIAVRPARRGKARPEQTQTLDLSRGGASFITRRPYRAGASLRVAFLDLQHLAAEFRDIPARVVRSVPLVSSKKTAVAVSFQGVNPANLIFSELLRVKMRTSSALLGIIQSLSSGTDLSAVIHQICKTTEQALDAERALLFLRDLQRPVLRARQATSQGFEEIEIIVGEGLVGKAAESSGPINVASLDDDARVKRQSEKCFDDRTKSVLCIPLSKEKGASPGVLVLINKRFAPFTREDEGLGMAVATQIALVLREAHLIEDVRSMKEYYERILESIATGILTFDQQGKLITVNKAGADIFGFQPAADLGKDYAKLFTGTANTRIASLAGDVLTRQSGATAYDTRFQRKDGINLSLNLNALPLQGMQGQPLGGVLVAEDITHEQRLMNTLCRYMAREVAEQVLQDKDKHKLGGTRMEVTILLTDIRNFTALAEEMDPWDVVELLNSYFPRMINEIFRQQGMVDKFIGDSILAVFGVPTPREDDALRAVRAALDMRKGLRAINKERGRKGLTTLEIGIGITSGTVISGNIGSERRMDYTVIGDPVNLASRLEGLTKQVQRRILINEKVHAAVAKDIPCDELGLFAIKGKREEVRVFAVKTPDE